MIACEINFDLTTTFNKYHLFIYSALPISLFSVQILTLHTQKNLTQFKKKTFYLFDLTNISVFLLLIGVEDGHGLEVEGAHSPHEGLLHHLLVSFTFLLHQGHFTVGGSQLVLCLKQFKLHKKYNFFLYFDISTYCSRSYFITATSAGLVPKIVITFN